MAEFWRGDSCTVLVDLHEETGDFVFAGSDRKHLGGYEYYLSVPPDQFAAIRRALGGAPDEDLVKLVCDQVDQIMPGGEKSWLDANGIGYRFHAF